MKETRTIIRRERLKKCKAQGEFARRVGVPQSMLSALERGYGKAGPIVAAKLCVGLGVAKEEILDAEGWPLMVTAG